MLNEDFNKNDLEKKKELMEKQFKQRKSVFRVIIALVLFSSLGVFLACTCFILLMVRYELARTKTIPSFMYLYPVVMAVIFFILFMIGRFVIWTRILDPVSQIIDTIGKYAKDKSDGTIDDFYFGHLQIHTGDEFEALSVILGNMEMDIATSEQKLIRATAEKQRINTELDIANQIQANMLPTIFPPYPDRNDFEIYATMEPAKEVGGDFFDFHLIDQDHLGIVMADVSGKGIPAALFMMSSMIVIDNMSTLSYSPKQVLEMSNKKICEMGLVDMFVTVWFGILDLKTGVVTAANAGHEYPAICQPGGEFALMKAKHGFVVGGMEDIEYQEYTFTLKKGAALFLYTDGVPEAADAENKLYGTERMIAALNKNKELPPKKLLKEVRSDISSFVGSAPQFDDLTMLCIRYLGE